MSLSDAVVGVAVAVVAAAAGPHQGNSLMVGTASERGNVEVSLLAWDQLRSTQNLNRF